MEKGGRKGEGGDRERSEGDWDRKKFGTVGGSVRVLHSRERTAYYGLI